MSRLAGGLVVAVLALAASMPATAGPLWNQTMPLGRKAPLVLVHDGVTVRLSPVTHHVAAEGDSEEHDEELAEVQVTFPGAAPYIVPADEARLDVHGIAVGIGRLSPRDSQPVVILEGYSGGAHCCATFQLVALTPAGPVTRQLAMIDGGPGLGFPRDIDGDGVRDVVRQDDSQRYVFASGAGSWSPPTVFNLIGGELADVTTAPRYAAMWRRYAAETWRACAKKREFEGNGACAAYGAAMARLGRGEEGLDAVAKVAKWPAMFQPEICRVATADDEPCPDGQEQYFTTFRAALRWHLGETGYLPTVPPAPSELAGRAAD